MEEILKFLFYVIILFGASHKIGKAKEQNKSCVVSMEKATFTLLEGIAILLIGMLCFIFMGM
jgi:hypothetical protein